MAAISGTVTADVVLSVQTSGGVLSSPVTASYTVLSSDTLGSVATGLAIANTKIRCVILCITEGEGIPHYGDKAHE